MPSNKLKYNQEYRKRNRAKLRASRKAYYEKNRELERNKTLVSRYGIDYPEYLRLLEVQEKKCAICKKHQKDIKVTFNVDHDHSTGKVRGLLCTSCNRGIGYLGDSVSLLEAAIIYLQKGA